MHVAIDEVHNQNKICEGTICYTNDATDPNEKKYTLKAHIGRQKKQFIREFRKNKLIQP